MKRTKTQILTDIRALILKAVTIAWAPIHKPTAVQTTGIYARPSQSHAGQVFLYLYKVGTNGVYIPSTDARALGQRLLDSADLAEEFAGSNNQTIMVTLQNGSEVAVPVPASVNGKINAVRLS